MVLGLIVCQGQQHGLLLVQLHCVFFAKFKANRKFLLCGVT